ncbi:MAG TPA: lamin tail domain-containing protein, partial [Roseiarcus sp.]|nr:lamin tail domain-containing protein [Roseiarcus sp.]
EGTTGAEPPQYDFSDGLGAKLPLPPRAAEITSAHRAPDGAGTAVVTNMSAAPLDLSGWSILAEAKTSVPLPAGAVAPGQTIAVALSGGTLVDEGGILTLRDPAGRRVDGVAYIGGDAAHGWSTSF